MLPFFLNDSYKMKQCTKFTKKNKILNREFSNDDEHQIIYRQHALDLLLAEDNDSPAYYKIIQVLKLKFNLLNIG